MAQFLLYLLSKPVLISHISNTVFKHNQRQIAPYRLCSKLSYRAAVLNELNKPLEIRDDLITKSLKKDEIRLNVEYCSVNYTDVCLFTKGLKELKPPIIPGYEMSGEIVEVAKDISLDAESFHLGDRVVALSKLTGLGGLATSCIVKVKDAWKIPYNVKGEDAAVLPCGHATALLAFSEICPVKENDVVVISVGAAGMGLAAIDIAVNVYKAKVIAVVDSEERGDLVRQRGAYKVITYQPERNASTSDNDKVEDKSLKEQRTDLNTADNHIIKDEIKRDDKKEPSKAQVKAVEKAVKKHKKVRQGFLKELKAAVGENGPTLLYDVIGGELLCLLSTIVTEGHGKVVTAFPFYEANSIDKLASELLPKIREEKNDEDDDDKKENEKVDFNISSKISHVSLHTYRDTDIETYRTVVNDILEMSEEGLINGYISKIFQLNEINDAIKFIQDFKCSGKVLIDMGTKNTTVN